VADRTIAIRDGRTSTETVRRDAPLRQPTGDGRASAIIGLPSETHRESVLIDRAGRLQLPREAVERIPFNGHADVRIADDHVELWPIEVEVAVEVDAMPEAPALDHAALAPSNSHIVRGQQEA
jgi:hypothetical protein